MHPAIKLKTNLIAILALLFSNLTYSSIILNDHDYTIPSITEFQLYKLNYIGSSLDDYYCQDGSFANVEYTVNIETYDILQEGHVYYFDAGQDSGYYIVLDVLSPSQGYPIFSVNQTGDQGPSSQVCDPNAPSGSSQQTINIPKNESFESNLGQWKNSSSNVGAWRRDAGGTPTSYTGPSSAHSGTYYIYAEANDYLYNAILESETLAITKNTSQFSFHYSMFGQGMGGLHLELSSDDGLSWSTVWAEFDDQGTSWRLANVDLSSYEYQEILLRFKTDIGQTYQSDIAIDNVQFNARTGDKALIGQKNLNQNENYIFTTSLREPVTQVSNIDESTSQIQSVQYFDELGRLKQSVNIRGGGNQEDIVTPVLYDSYGRNSKEFLPYAVTSNNKGDFQANAIGTQASFYNTQKYSNTNNPYLQKIFDGSGKDLIVESGAPGNDWDLSKQNPHSTNNSYQLLARSDDVKHYSVSYNSSSNPFNPTLVNNGFFMNQQGSRPALFKFTTKNENWKSGDGSLNTNQTFVDYQNRTLLNRSFVTKNGVINKVDTYYVYDDFGNLIFVLTPEAEASYQTPTQSILDNLCYQYKYDFKNRLVEKKLPGKAKEYLIYNDLGSPIMMQDGELRKKNQWQFTKYDELGRVIYTGLVNNSASRTAIQALANDELVLYDTRKTSSPLNIGGAQIYYTNNSFPNSNIAEILTIQYYDSYLPNGADGYFSRPSTNNLNESLTIKVKSLMTVTREKVLGSSSPVKWINTTMGYDKYGRPVWIKKENQHLSSTTTVQNDLDFDGNILETKTYHTKSGIASAIDLYDYFSYDHYGRMIEHSQKLNSESQELISRSFYDELGQLESKQVGGDINGLGLQQLDFSYNVRGWLTSVNDINSLGNDVFAYRLNYNNRTMNLSGTVDLFNGNISEMIWRSGNTGSNGDRRRGYAYSYDELDRITNAYFRRATSGGSYTEQSSAYNVTGMDYDLNGNIEKLQRRGVYNSSGSIGAMDDLTYSYNGNKLLKVEDSDSDSYGFVDKTRSGSDYEYDDNGNLVFDFNKGITLIKYNYLNLPKEIYVQSSLANGYLKNTYSATGQKLEKYNQETGTRTYYDANFVYTKPSGSNTTLTFFNNPEGYVEANSGSFQYVYHFKDHLGNIRMKFTDTDDDNFIDASNNEILDEKHYYPFGMEHKGYNNTNIGTYHNYGYNGNEELKELSLDLMDFNARNYNPEIGRFMNIDPFAEDQKQIDKSPYAFSWNNPVILSDPTGLKPADYEEDYRKLRELFEAIEKHEPTNLDFGIRKLRQSSDSENESSAEKKDGCCPDLPESFLDFLKSIFTWETTTPEENDYNNHNRDLLSAGVDDAKKAAEVSYGVIFELATVPLGGPGKIKGGKTAYKFAKEAASHMDDINRFVPVQILDDVIKNTKAFPDPQNSSAIMHYAQMARNKTMYNLEVLYDKTTNTIYHFKYTRQAIGPLKKISK